MPDQADSDGVLAQFAAGATILLQANTYVRPPANRGFDAHYDMQTYSFST